MTLPPPGQFDFSQQRRTFRLELLRSLPQGFVETAMTTFAVFVAIRIFHLPAWMKGAILASGSVGLLLSLFVVQLIRRRGWTVNHAAATFWCLSAVGFGMAAAAGSRPVLYFAGTCFASVCLASASPLMAQIYRKHYANENRGRLFSLSSLTHASTVVVAGYALGLWIERQGFPPLFAAYAGGALLMALCVRAMAPVRLRASNRIRWFDAFSHVRGNRAFAKLLVTWMLLGLGNLMSMALFVEFIGNPAYGFGYDAKMSGLVTSTVPMAAFILTVVPWGEVFDKLPFYRVRAMVNLFFIAGILIYYLGSSFATLCAGIALHGIARSGGNILWMLWTTRFAEEDRLSEYQSVHSFLTGVRGVLAPFLAYLCLEHLGPVSVATVASSLLLLGTLVIAPEIRDEFLRKSPS
jgi:MFS family permease